MRVNLLLPVLKFNSNQTALKIKLHYHTANNLEYLIRSRVFNPKRHKPSLEILYLLLLLQDLLKIQPIYRLKNSDNVEHHVEHGVTSTSRLSILSA